MLTKGEMKMEARKLLLYLSKKYNGNWDKIMSAIQNKEDVPPEEIEKVYKDNKEDFICLLDIQYPSTLKHSLRPPFVLYYKGNINLLNSIKTKVAIGGVRSLTMREEDVANLIFNDDSNVHILDLESGIGKYLEEQRPYDNIIVSATALDNVEEVNEGTLYISEKPIGSTKEINSFHSHETRRISAALCDKALVFSCVQGCAVLNLINFALHLGKDVLAVPTSPLVKDYENNSLIREGAIPVYDAVSYREETKQRDF